MTKIDLQPTLVGETVTLRPLLSEVFSSLHQAASDPVIWKMSQVELLVLPVIMNGIQSSKKFPLVTLFWSGCIGEMEPTKR